MTKDFTFSIKSIPFDEEYHPLDGTRITTNFANLARGESRRENLRRALRMIDNRCNELACWDNPDADRYGVELDIVSVELDIEGKGDAFPAIEILKTTIVDRKAGTRTDGITGNNFSSYVRDYDFSVRLPDYNKGRESFGIPEDFGDLHGKLFKSFIASDAYTSRFAKRPVICLSVSDNKTYHRTANRHPVLGAEYTPSDTSLTEHYFSKMGLQVRYFMPPNGKAPLAFFFFGDLLADYTDMELIATISTMETFQKIYRPEIYNANSAASAAFRPSLRNEDHSLTRIVYDREERSRLATTQGKFAQDHFITPHRAILDEWSARYSN
ncbi:putative oxygenase MesX [Falsirhodobacter algicola]|uniref:DUF1852 family protein n=1 Tax=Falsirhodobacter algicola TaxID=2692330 RepID=A0A8J8MT51_9RHOB|nr:putative oxygenase MesX [Falsirhodobacter algicola]QUS36212.1 DUF1852 family protein [Falsirhodobacter algicola]